MTSLSVRTRKLNQVEVRNGPVVYWMSRDQRVQDNWALIEAQSLAIELKQSLVVVFCLQDDFLGAGKRQFNFMISGLHEVSKHLNKLNIQFKVLYGLPDVQIPKFCKEYGIGAVVCDFSPLRIGRQWRDAIANKLNVAVLEVDTHNIVPAWLLSNKQEYSASSIRPKIMRSLDKWLEEFPELKRMETIFEPNYKLDLPKLNDPKSGFKAAQSIVDKFIDSKLVNYKDKKNNPAVDGVSGLSVYLHFGQISAARVAMQAIATTGKINLSDAIIELFRKQGMDQFVMPANSVGVFLEELIVRRELADNYCLYNTQYDQLEGFSPWAQITLEKHKTDKRDYVYNFEEFENAKTHDDLWNACQREMVSSAKMHGYMRMYWAKKILEWSETPATAMSIAVTLNDKYEMDGRDPNGYSGVAWAIGGVHDRPWFERSVFGLVRYMARSGCERKFDVQAYIDKWK